MLIHDPLNNGTAVSDSLILIARDEIIQYPIQISTGEWYWYDPESRDMLDEVIYGLEQGLITTVAWRQVGQDSSTVTARNLTEMGTLKHSMRIAAIARGAQVDAEYLLHKANGATLRDLENWKLQYVMP